MPWVWRRRRPVAAGRPGAGFSPVLLIVILLVIGAVAYFALRG